MSNLHSGNERSSMEVHIIPMDKLYSTVQLMQLQTACEAALRRRVFDTGTYSALNTPELFLKKIKELAVIVDHKSLHLINLWRMSQQPVEPIRAFTARVTATADMCGMTMKCSTLPATRRTCTGIMSSTRS